MGLEHILVDSFDMLVEVGIDSYVEVGIGGSVEELGRNFVVEECS